MPSCWPATRLTPTNPTWPTPPHKLQVIVNARKPDFFVHSMSLYEVVTEDGLMRPSYSLRRGGVYCGGSGAWAGGRLGVLGVGRFHSRLTRLASRDVFIEVW